MQGGEDTSVGLEAGRRVRRLPRRFRTADGGRDLGGSLDSRGYGALDTSSRENSLGSPRLIRGRRSLDATEAFSWTAAYLGTSHLRREQERCPEKG